MGTLPTLSRCAGLLLLSGVLLGSMGARAQVPGIEPPEKAEPAAKAADAALQSTAAAMAARQEDEAAESGQAGWGLTRKWTHYMGKDSPYRGLILVALTLFVLLNAKACLTRTIRRKLKEHGLPEETTAGFVKTWNALWKVVITVLTIMAMSGSVRLLGLTAGFMGMMLGWSLQQPVTGIAAWLMIVLKKPFCVGDRVVIAGITGDVTGITMTHVILNQVGGSIAGEEQSGRGILVPNAILFQNVIINYTLAEEFMLDEVPVRVTFGSDWERAKEIMVAAATEVTKDIVAKTGEPPFIRAEFFDCGILARLRYKTIPAHRQETSTYIIEVLLREFGKEFPRVRFAVPAQYIEHRPDAALAGPSGPVAPGAPPQ